MLLGIGRMLFYASMAAISTVLFMFRDCLDMDRPRALWTLMTCSLIM